MSPQIQCAVKLQFPPSNFCPSYLYPTQSLFLKPHNSFEETEVVLDIKQCSRPNIPPNDPYLSLECLLKRFRLDSPCAVIRPLPAPSPSHVPARLLFQHRTSGTSGSLWAQPPSAFAGETFGSVILDHCFRLPLVLPTLGGRPDPWSGGLPRSLGPTIRPLRVARRHRAPPHRRGLLRHPFAGTTPLTGTHCHCRKHTLPNRGARSRSAG